MANRKFSFWLWLLIEWVAFIALVRWLVGISWWLDLFLGSAMSNAAEFYRRIRSNRELFDITDAELVRVSALANSLDEEVAQLRTQLAEADDKIEELQRGVTRPAGRDSGPVW